MLGPGSGVCRMVSSLDTREGQWGIEDRDTGWLSWERCTSGGFKKDLLFAQLKNDNKVKPAF